MDRPWLTDLASTLRSGGDASLPGAVIGLDRAGDRTVAVSGDAQRVSGDEPVRFDADTRTDVGSVTKIIATTAALMRLVDRRLLRTDTSVESILALGLPTDITVADLLEHQAGLWEWWPLYLGSRTPGRAVAAIAGLVPRYPRRTGRHYSDLGFMLLGRIVEERTGLRLDRACQELVFDPFQMSATRYATPAPGGTVAASSYGDRIEQTMIDTGRPYPVSGRADDFDGWRSHPLIGEVNDGNSFHAYGSAAGHAGVFSTVPDLLRFGRVIMDGLNGSGPVDGATAGLFLTPGADPGQAYGWRIWSTAAGPAIGHTGFPGVGLAVLPEHDAVLALATNRLHVRGQPTGLEELWRRVLDPVAAALTGAAR